MCKEDAIQILGEVYTGCSKVFPREIHDAYLYGSYARGDFHEESDVDILLTVDMDWAEISSYRSAVSHVVSDLCLKYDVTVSVTIKPLKLFTQFAEDLPFYRNVRTEGIRYVSSDTYCQVELSTKKQNAILSRLEEGYGILS